MQSQVWIPAMWMVPMVPGKAWVINNEPVTGLLTPSISSVEMYALETGKATAKLTFNHLVTLYLVATQTSHELFLPLLCNYLLYASFLGTLRKLNCLFIRKPVIRKKSECPKNSKSNSSRSR